MTAGGVAAPFGTAWVAAVLALALHVADEAAHDFLAWYNPRALRIRQRFGRFPFPPTFTFWPWLLGLSAAVVVLAVLTPLAFAGDPGMRWAAFALGAIHVANGSLHLAGAIIARRAVPGVWTAPVLLLAGAWVVLAAAQL
ncbi:MAG TPA: HXXEE domain-containing protein [Gemmatimonadales bacterium]|nr:HXXEE domain-containing protein [Gemmatimonadales bacterium]